MNATTILLVDDDQNIREIIRLYLEKENYHVEEAADGIEAIRQIEKLNPQLVILDIMMPILDGIEVCRQIRKFSKVPIIMLSARAEDEDRIMGLELGADDYIAKPFHPREVVARVNAVLRRIPDSEFTTATTLHFTDLDINIADYTVSHHGQTVSLTAKEMELLWCLASKPGRTFSREILLEKIWGYTYEGETRTIDNHIRRLRQKIGADAANDWDIKTVWGVGYRFEIRQ